jgi:hypothetical protein
MNKIFSVRLLMGIVAVGLGCGAFAQDQAASSLNTFEMLPVIFPWMKTSNTAALSDLNLGNMSLAQTGYMYTDDELTFIQQPEMTSSFNVSTKGFMQLKKISLYGSFGYSNTGFEGLNYNGTLMFNTFNPYLVGDTVSARQFMEKFDMEGKLSYSLNDRITLALGAGYLSAVGAKQKDPRNKNTIASLKISPGITYDFGTTKVGLSGSVYTTSNELSYSVEGNWNQNLFVFLGLGYYRQELNISSYSQWYTGNGYSGAFQASHNSGDLFMLAELCYDHFNEEARSGSSFRLIDGITVTDDISLSGQLKLTRGQASHLFTLNASFKAVSSDEILQRSYTVNKGTYSYDSLATVSWIENKHMINDIGGGVRYSYLVLDSDRNIDIELGGAVMAGYFSTEHFPVQSYGYYNTFNLSGSFFARKLFRAGRLLVTPGLDIGYRMNLGFDISYIIQPLSIPDMVYHDYFVSKADVIMASASARCEMPLSQNNFVKSLFLIPEGRWAAAPGSEAGELSGYMIGAVAGFIF